jgi:hypothetical protein
MTPSIQLTYGEHVDMDNRKNVSFACAGKILKTFYLSYLDFKEYNSTSVQCRTFRWSDTEVETLWLWESFEIIVIIKTCSCHVIVDMKNEHTKCSKEGLNIMALHNLVGWRYCVTTRHLRNIRNSILKSFFLHRAHSSICICRCSIFYAHVSVHRESMLECSNKMTHS